MRSTTKDRSTPGGHPNQGLGGPTGDSDRVQAPVVAAGSSAGFRVSQGSGESQSTQALGKTLEELSTSHEKQQCSGLLKPKPRLRYDSASSIGSGVSGVSGFTALSAESREEVEEFQESFEKAQESNRELKRLYDELKTELKKMTSACERQKNISQTVKDGIKNITTLIDVYQKSAEECWKWGNECSLVLADYRDHHDARRIEKKEKLNRMKSAIAASAERKRARSPESSPEKKANRKKKKRKKKKEEDKGGSSMDVPKIVVNHPDAEKKPAKKRGPKVLVKVAEGQTFASVLRKIKTDFKPENCNVTVLGAVKTAKGDVLLKLKKDSDTQKMATNLDEIVAGLGRVAESKEPKVTIEIRDLDVFVEKGEVEEAVERVLGRRREVTLLRPNGRQQRMALVVLQEDEANKLEHLGHLRIGFISCRVRKRIDVKRCFRCLGFGHTAAGCKDENRSKLCFRCGTCNHRKKDCKEKPRCYLCKESNEHEAGSGACPVFRQALEAAKKEAYSKKR